MADEKKIVITKENAGERLDVFASKTKEDLTRSHVQKLLEEGNLSVNGKIVKAGYKLKIDDTVTLVIPEPKVLSARPEAMDLPIVYEDDDLAIVNKPRGLVVHPSVGHEDGTMVNGLMYQFKGKLSGINGVLRPGIVHRIDKDTSGLLCVCKSDLAHQRMSELLKTHDIERVYHAVVHGVMKQTEGTIDAPIGRMNQDRKKMCIRSDGREAISHYTVLKQFSHFAYIEVRLETGRTHQIRVHMQSIGHPVLGDPIYGPMKETTPEGKRLSKEAFWPGQILHAKTLGFVHPITGEFVSFDSELPDYFKTVLKEIE